MTIPIQNQQGLATTARRYALLSVGAAVVTITLKSTAYGLTGSVGLLSDAMESVVNLVAALVAVWALTLASRPADQEHAYGHTKAEYFASAVEGIMIIIAALAIGAAAGERLLHPQPLERVWLGLGVALVAALVNGGVAWVLLQAGRRLRSITLQADAQHLLTDVWSSGGVVLGVGLVQLTGWLPFDPLIALLVAANIIWTGVRLMRTTADGMLDGAWPAEEQAGLAAVLALHEQAGIVFHALRTRLAGQRRFVSLHILVPGAWPVQQAHDLAETIEQEIRARLPNTTVFTHLEPAEDRLSWADQLLDRSVSNEHP
jgi:cation diffusion facilitator family transporter